MDDSITVCRVGMLVFYGRGHYSLSIWGVSFVWTSPLHSVEWGYLLFMDETITVCRAGVLILYGRVHYSLSSGVVSFVWTSPLQSVEWGICCVWTRPL